VSTVFACLEWVWHALTVNGVAAEKVIAKTSNKPIMFFCLFIIFVSPLSAKRIFFSFSFLPTENVISKFTVYFRGSLRRLVTTKVSATQDQVLKTLQDLGLTRLDSQIYIYLSKKGLQKGAEISKGLKVQKQPLYRCLKHLQSRGIVTATLEHPAKFSAVSFDKVVDIFVKVKMAEAQRIQENKKELLAKWQELAIGESTDTSATFSVIEGRGNIYSKIMQMIKEAKTQLSTISTTRGLVRADQFGLFDTMNDNAPRVDFRVLTQISKQEVHAVQDLLKDMKKATVNIDVRTPELGLNLFPEMVIRDDEETIFFISPTDSTATEESDVCFWTDCKSLVQAMKTVYESIWVNSSGIQFRMAELETGKTLPKKKVFANSEEAFEKYNDLLYTAGKEVTILTSPPALMKLKKQDQLLLNWVAKHVDVRIMVPVTRSLLGAVQHLSKFCQIKHVPIGCLGTTIVDGKELFQFDWPSSDYAAIQDSHYFNSAFYSNDCEYVEKTSKMLDDLWENAQDPHIIISESSQSVDNSEILAENNPFRKMIGLQVIDIKPLTETEILSEIIEGRKLGVTNPEKEPHKIYATAGSAIIHPPSFLNLPEIMIEVAQVESQSSLGPTDLISVYQWLNTGKDVGYALVAMVYTTAKPHAAAKQLYKDTLAGDNIQLVSEDELQIRVHGNIMFVGWTVPIPLWPRNLVLPPACLTLEGYGKVHPLGFTLLSVYGAKSIIKQNVFDAFVTFMHPNSTYSGAGTDGFFARDYILTLQPPS
jgi:sugar-specific transcriptional regulator TrmB